MILLSGLMGTVVNCARRAIIQMVGNLKERSCKLSVCKKWGGEGGGNEMFQGWTIIFFVFS